MGSCRSRTTWMMVDCPGIKEGDMARASQCEMILQYLKDFGSISPKEAYEDIGCMRLAARIEDLEKKGYVFATKSEGGKNRYGRTVSWTRYSFAKEEG